MAGTDLSLELVLQKLVEISLIHIYSKSYPQEFHYVRKPLNA